MKKFNFLNIIADNDDVDITINGEIISNDMQELYDFFGIESTSPNKFAELLNSHEGKNVTIHIDSGGGVFFAGVAMYNAIKNFKGKTTAEIDGVCASAATLPAVACQTVKMTAPSVMMIHNASLSTFGNKNDLLKDVNALKSIDNSISNAYEIKTGMSREKVQKLMDSETWMDAKKAKELGFCDIIDEELILPEKVIKNIINSRKLIWNSIYKKVDPKPKINTEYNKSIIDFLILKNKKMEEHYNNDQKN